MYFVPILCLFYINIKNNHTIFKCKLEMSNHSLSYNFPICIYQLLSSFFGLSHSSASCRICYCVINSIRDMATLTTINNDDYHQPNDKIGVFRLSQNTKKSTIYLGAFSDLSSPSSSSSSSSSSLCASSLYSYSCFVVTL